MGDEALFSFDVDPLMGSLKKMGDGMGDLQERARSLGSTVTKSIGSALTVAATKAVTLFAAFKSAKAALKEMPEVGQAFGIAKDIFLTNLVWPLRQKVMPMLQSMLDWVRDHRAQFVRWGSTVANVFTATVTAAKSLWNVLKAVGTSLADSFQKAIGTNFKSFDEFIDVLSFKVSAAIVYFGMLSKDLVLELKPALDWVVGTGTSVIDFFVRLAASWGTTNERGHSLNTVMSSLKETLSILSTAVRSAWDGFKEGFLSSNAAQLMTPVTSMVDTFNRLLNILGLNDSDGLRGGFFSLGNILGDVVGAAFDHVAATASALVTSLGIMVQLIRVVGSLSKGDFKGAWDELKEIKTIWGEYRETSNMLLGKYYGGAQPAPQGQTQVRDAIITKTGHIIHTDPSDNIVATKNVPAMVGPSMERPSFSSVTSSRSVSIAPTFGPFYVTVQAGADPKAVGRDLGAGMAETFVGRVSSSRIREGL